MTPADQTPPEHEPTLRSRSYRITVDGGRDSFFALSIEDAECETAWLMSDTVFALEQMR
ncbi:hypothetical protein [Halosolutus gelatinilyticus]|uniref:hypothetical protein n=1 Tax=Halosolutus gelatinilyticus TaxID=2931975 RepID=UPI001FF6858E|nr:hypothetical protein [Halosolutus gelatinilyticus]